MRRPGVYVFTQGVGAAMPAEPTVYTYMVVGYAPWGPVDRPVLLGSYQDAQYVFGQPDISRGYELPLALKHYFDVAGLAGRALAVRGINVEPGKTLNDYVAKANVTSSTGATIFTVLAAWPGSVGNRMVVNISPGRKTGEYLVTVWGPYGVPETFYWDSTDEAAMRSQAARINQAADNLSSSFRLQIPTPFNSSAPGKLLSQPPVRPDVANGYPLTGGSDGGSRTASALVGTVDPVRGPTGLQALADPIYGPGVVDIYGFTGSAVANALDLHAAQFRRLALRQLTPAGADVNTALTTKTSIGGSAYSADYYPWVYDLDGNLVPVTPFVAGLGALKVNRLDREGGVKASWTGPLPISGIEKGAGGRDVVKGQAAELLFANRINYVMLVRGAGYRLESQLLSVPEGVTSRISHRITLNAFAYGIEEIASQFRDRVMPATGATEQEIVAAIAEYLAPYEAGRPSPQGDTIYGKAIVTNRTTTEDKNRQILRVEVQVALSPHAEMVVVGITQVPITG